MEQEQSVEVSEALGSVGVSTDDRPIYEAWRKGSASERLAYTATQKVREMAGINVISVLGARIEAQGAELGARIEAQGAELRARIEAQGAELRARIEAQGVELRARIEDQRAALAAQTASLRWMIRILIAVFVSILALLAQSLLRPPVPAVGTVAVMPKTVEPTPVDRTPEEVGASVTEEAPPVAP